MSRTGPHGLKISRARHWDRMMAMAAIGSFEDPDGHHGVNRPCLSELDRLARRLLLSWASAIGLAPSVDPMGNLFLRYEGTAPWLPPVLTGSHMDTQQSAGRFDGIWGVLAALEALEAMHEAGFRPRRAIEIVAWTNEEGGRFPPGCMGSKAFTGLAPRSTWDAVTDGDGIRFADALRAHLASEADLARRPLGVADGKPAPYAYVEAHIEQGPVLEARGDDVGIVSGIMGCRWWLVDIAGRADHAGTTPGSLRRDAVQDMVRAIAALNLLMADPEQALRFTVGKVVVSPNTPNLVADRVRFTVDCRHLDDRLLDERCGRIESTVRSAMQACAVQAIERFRVEGTPFGNTVPEAIAAAAARLGLKASWLPSGAFHDAQFLARICPTGMIFIPSRGGISHHPAEFSDASQLAAGASVLAAVLADLAAR